MIKTQSRHSALELNLTTPTYRWLHCAYWEARHFRSAERLDRENTSPLNRKFKFRKQKPRHPGGPSPIGNWLLLLPPSSQLQKEGDDLPPHPVEVEAWILQGAFHKVYFMISSEVELSPPHREACRFLISAILLSYEVHSFRISSNISLELDDDLWGCDRVYSSDCLPSDVLWLSEQTPLKRRLVLEGTPSQWWQNSLHQSFAESLSYLNKRRERLAQQGRCQQTQKKGWARIFSSLGKSK